MFFGVLVITIVYVPVLALTGIEGKMFRPMVAVLRAHRFPGALDHAHAGALLVFSRRQITRQTTGRCDFCKAVYRPVLTWALRCKLAVVLAAVMLFGGSIFGVYPAGGRVYSPAQRGDAAPPVHSKQQCWAERLCGLAKAVRETAAGKVP